MEPQGNAAASVRYETFEGRRHLVAPVALLVEGVHTGMGGRALFYPASELARFPAAWNGRPVPMFHPTERDEDGAIIPVSANSPEILQRESVGYLFNAWYDDDGRALRAEIWVDEERARRKAPGGVVSLEKGEKIEVSTGLWGDIEEIGGVWKGEPYEAIFRNYLPDHMALLPGREGACNIKDGCGVFNEKGGKLMKGEGTISEKPVPGKLRRAINYLSWLTGKKGDEILAAAGITMNEEFSHDACRMKLQEMMDAMDTWDRYNVVREIYDNYFIFESVGMGEGMPRKTMKMGYKMDKDGHVEMTGEAMEVREKKTYVPVSQGNEGAEEPDVNQKEGPDVDKTAIVTALIANQGNRFADTDREFLMGLTEEQLAKFSLEEKKAEAALLQANCEACTKKAAAPKANTVGEYVAQAPAPIRGALLRAVRMEEDRKSALVQGLLANERNKFSQEQLQGKDVEELEALAALAGAGYREEGPNLNFSLQGGGYQANHSQGWDVPALD